MVAAFCVFAWISAHKPAGDEKKPDAAAPAAAGHPAPAQAQEGASAHGAAPSNAAAASSEPAAKGSPAVVPAMRLLPPPPRNPDSVFGHVRAPSGRGLAQARVALIGADGKEVATTTTGPDGRYSFDLVKPASYTVVATDPDFLYTVSEPATAVAEKGKAVETDVTMKRGAARISGVVLDFAGVFVHVRTFAPQIVANRGPEARIHDPVHGPGVRRDEPAAHLVFALRAGFEARDAALDAELDALVVTGFEMQAVVLRVRAPVAAVQRRGAPEKHCDRRGLAVVTRALDHEFLTERLRHRPEERAGQVGLMAVPQERVAMQVVHLVDGLPIEVSA